MVFDQRICEHFSFYPLRLIITFNHLGETNPAIDAYSRGEWG